MTQPTESSRLARSSDLLAEFPGLPDKVLELLTEIMEIRDTTNKSATDLLQNRPFFDVNAAGIFLSPTAKAANDIKYFRNVVKGKGILGRRIREQRIDEPHHSLHLQTKFTERHELFFTSATSEEIIEITQDTFNLGRLATDYNGLGSESGHSHVGINEHDPTTPIEKADLFFLGGIAAGKSPKVELPIGQTLESLLTTFRDRMLEANAAR